jgi:hypothetical protein
MKPKYIYADSNSVPWENHEIATGVEIKKLCSLHNGPEFVFLLDGSARVNGKWIHAGWSSAAEAGTLDKEFLSGDTGCIFLSVYTQGSQYVE